MRILLAEDEKALAKALVKIFESNNYSIDAVHDGQDALDYLEAGNYDAAVLDIMMPKVDGITVLKKLRESGSDLPVLMLTAKSEIDDKVLGNEVDTKMSFGNITLDRASYELSGPAGDVKLANKEFQMMELLMAKPGNIISVDTFMDHIWGYDSDTESNVVWVYVSYLRKKLTAIGSDVKIKASRNAGYSLVTE